MKLREKMGIFSLVKIFICFIGVMAFVWSRDFRVLIIFIFPSLLEGINIVLLFSISQSLEDDD